MRPTTPDPDKSDTWILLAKSPGQNPCGKICSQHGAKLDENGTSTLTNSTIIQNIGSVCRLVVISPTVSKDFSARAGPIRPKMCGHTTEDGALATGRVH